MGFKHKGNDNPHRGIARRRKMTGLTQFDLARLAGISLARLTYIETGRTDPLPDELHKIRYALRKRAKQVVQAVGT